jgi:hypothetical protein
MAALIIQDLYHKIDNIFPCEKVDFLVVAGIVLKRRKYYSPTFMPHFPCFVNS